MVSLIRPSTSIRRLRLAPALFAALSIVLCSGGLLANPLRIAVYELAEPFMTRADQQPEGLLPDFWRLWSQRSGVEIEFVPFEEQGDAIAALEAQQVDILAAVGIDAATWPSLSPSRPFARLTRGVVAPLGFQVEDLRGQQLRLEGPKMGNELEAIQSAYEIDSFREGPFSTLRELFRESSDPVLTLSLRWSTRRIREEGFEDRLTVIPLTNVPLFAATSKGREEVLSLFHEGLSRISLLDLERIDRDASVALPPLFLEPRDRFDLSLEELRWLRDHPVVSLGASTWPPLTIIDSAGRYTGIGIETVRELLQRIGIQLQVVGAKDWLRVVDWARERRIDGLGFTARVDGGDFLYSDSVIQSPAVIVNRTDGPFLATLQDLSDGKLAVLDYRAFESVPDLVRPTLELITAPDSATAARWTAEGRVDATLDFLPTARGAIRGQGINNLKVTATVPELTTRLQVALRPDWPELVQLLDRAIATRSRADENRLLDRFSDTGPARTNWPILAVLMSLSAATLVLGISLIRRRLLTNQLLRESEALLRSAQRLSKSGSWRLDPTTQEIVFSAESFRLFGDGPEAVPEGAQTYLEYYEPDSRSRLQNVLSQPPSPGQTEELRSLRSANGEHVHDCVVEAAKGDLVGTITDVTDIDRAQLEREQMQERLRQTERLDALGRLAGGIAHDFNNILAVSMTNAQLARMEIDDDHEAQESLKEVIDATERARELVRQIQIFGRRSTAERDQIDLRACIDSVIPLLRASLPPNVRVHCSLPEEPLSLHGSATQIERVVMNLGVNASEAMGPNGGIIHIAARPIHTRQPLLTAAGELSPGNYVQLQVSDTGRGIAEDDLPRVFDPYFTRRVKEGGTGLGLALVHGIVQDHEGGLAVSSSTDRKPDEVATTFSIWLPLASAEGTVHSLKPRVHASTPWSESVTPINGQDQRLLVVDDQQHVLRSTVRMLEAMGFEAVGFSEPFVALETFREDPRAWDGVVTDLLMSGLSGAEMAEEMKAVDPTVPIVLMTGHAGDVDLESAATDAVIFKPTLPGAWFEALRQVGVIKKTVDATGADDVPPDPGTVDPASARSEHRSKQARVS